MAIIDKAVEEYNGLLRWKNRQVSKIHPKSELGLGLKKRAMLVGYRKNSFGPRQRMADAQVRVQQAISDKQPAEQQSNSTGSFKLIGSR